MKIHCVWTRNLDAPDLAGRIKVARRIRDTLDRWGRPTHHLMNTVLDNKRLPEIAQAAWNGGRHRLPMQCWLFDTEHNRKIAESIPRDADVVYLDGIRTVHVLRRLRQRLPHARLVVDLDDLMSRRTDELLAAGEGFAGGYLAEKMPRWGRSLGGPGLQYERRALRRWETRLCELADELVLLSPVEARILNSRVTGSRRARISAVPPPQETLSGPRTIKPPLRFVFIGTDALTQNRLTIKCLLELWRRLMPKVSLHVYGRMANAWSAPPNVFFHGYAKNLADVYDPHSVLLSPALLRGGVKTKVLEAFAWGTPVVGNANTFEGMALSDYPISGAVEDLIPSVESDAMLDRLTVAARIGNDYVRAKHDPKVFSATWRQIVTGADEPAANAAD